MYIILSVLVGLSIGVGISYFVIKPVNQNKIKEVEDQVEAETKKLSSIKEQSFNIKRNSHREQKRILKEAQKKADELLKTAEENIKSQKELLGKYEQNIKKEAQILEAGKKDLETKGQEAEQLKKSLEEQLQQNELYKAEIESKKEKITEELEKISGLTPEQASDIVLKEAKDHEKDNIANIIKGIQMEFKQQEKELLADVVLKCTQKYTNLIIADRTITVVNFEDEDFKAKIIGKSGRNIAVFQNITGVDVLIDDSPGQIVISCFDPVRRDVAKVALDYLIKDGRVHASKIEEAVRFARVEIGKVIMQRGADALNMVGLKNRDERLQRLVGRLYYRYSYSQNMLAHSVECAEIAEYIAQELRLPTKEIYLAKKAAFFHDIGKSVDREIAGTHVEIGVRIAEKYNFEPQVVHAIASHHEDTKPDSYIDYIVIMADKISSSRPGARRDTLENYIKRVTELESIAKEFDSVKNAYALSAGKEVRIFVMPEKADDTDCIILASTIATKVEQGINYSGEIKVVVIRESRVVEYAR